MARLQHFVTFTRCYRQGTLVNSDFPISEVSEHLREPDSVVWVDLCAPQSTDLELLAEELDLHALAIEDAVNARQRPKVDRYPEHSFLSAYSVHFDPARGRVSVEEISVFITAKALVTVRQPDGFDIKQVVARWDSSPNLAGQGVSFLLHGLLDYVVDTQFEAVESFDEQIDALEEQLFTSEDPEALQRRTFELRKNLVLLRRVALPMREVINTLMRRDLHLVDGEMALYFQDLYDHVLRVTEWTESLRDLITSILETNITVQGHRLNTITKKVTSWAAIVAVPTAITGFYGQNVPFPGFGSHVGFAVSSSVIVVGSVVLYFLFKRKDWL